MNTPTRSCDGRDEPESVCNEGSMRLSRSCLGFDSRRRIAKVWLYCALEASIADCVDHQFDSNCEADQQMTRIMRRTHVNIMADQKEYRMEFLGPSVQSDAWLPSRCSTGQQCMATCVVAGGNMEEEQQCQAHARRSTYANFGPHVRVQEACITDAGAVSTPIFFSKVSGGPQGSAHSAGFEERDEGYTSLSCCTSDWERCTPRSSTNKARPSG